MKQTKSILHDHALNIDSWLNQISHQYSDKKMHLLHQATHLAQLVGGSSLGSKAHSCLQQGLIMTEILSELNMDEETLAAAMVYGCLKEAELTLDDIKEHLGPNIAKLIHGVEKMAAIRNLQNLATGNTKDRSQIDTLRHMLIAMVEDVRVVLLKLAEQTYHLRTANELEEQERLKIAEETQQIYAPLASRLGIGQLKWEMEDLAFRYQHPASYKKIAKLVDAKRVDRELYVAKVIDVLNEELKKSNIPGKINGRAKHIYSIYNKMERKKVGFNQIYDAIAVRVLVDTVEQCYTVLGIVHNLWKSIPEEFDDYISHPKPNGYRSLHTAVIGPDEKNLEVQIRSYDMHHSSELGVAAHWAYKENTQNRQGATQDKISWLRQLLDWQKEVVKEEEKQRLQTDMIDERVYVFTPNGEVLDLPKGSTPLDFAYNIHSEIGHRCKGAKINGKIVPLTYHLQTGEQVEILTAKNGQPSRDWLSPTYLKTARARAKLSNWFHKLDYDKNREEGQQFLETEFKRFNIANINLHNIAKKLHFKTLDDMYAGLGSGEVKINQILNQIHNAESTATEKKVIPTRTIEDILSKRITTSPSDFHIEGIGNLLTNVARCCKPVPGDDIIGYITRGRGVTIHRKDCSNINNEASNKHERIVEVNWGQAIERSYPVDLYITANDKKGLIRDISTVFANEKLNLLGLNTSTDTNENMAYIRITVEISGLISLAKAIEKIRHIPGILTVTRSQTK